MKLYLAVAGDVCSKISFTEKCVHGLYCLIKISVMLKPLVCFDLVSDASCQICFRPPPPPFCSVVLNVK